MNNVTPLFPREDLLTNRITVPNSVFALDKLNLSGIDPKSTAFGIQAKVNVTLQDFADTDTWLDKYQADRVSGAALFSGVGYNPMDRKRFLVPEAPMIIDALPEDYGPHVNGGGRYEVDPLAMFSTRALWATAAGLIVALCIIAVLP